MASPIVCFDPKKFFFNIDANVGIGCPNRTDDVQLVQLGYFCMSTSTDSTVPASLKAACALVVPGAPYSGTAAEPLSQAILAHQRARGGTQDGHVSVIQSTSGMYSANSSYMLTSLNVHIRDRIPNDYPRIDKHPRCPSALRTSVIAACTFKAG